MLWPIAGPLAVRRLRVPALSCAEPCSSGRSRTFTCLWPAGVSQPFGCGSGGVELSASSRAPSLVV
eukprot:14419527-Alexandrium_andersonii.AAC.1